MGLPINQPTWWRLQLALLHCRQKYRKEDNTSISIETLFDRCKKGSRKFRIVLEKAVNLGNDITNLRMVNTFFNLVDLPVPNVQNLKTCLGSWNKPWLPSSIKYFVFRFRNNTLPIANRLNQYDPGINPNCFFCRMKNSQTRESFNHCFLTCSTVRELIRNFNDDFFADPFGVLTAEFYWQGKIAEDGSNTLQSILLSIWDIFRYIIFKYKSRNVVPNYPSVKNQTLFCLKTTLLHNRFCREYMSTHAAFARILQAIG
jgi:zinc-binding in reverse transcriptase